MNPEEMKKRSRGISTDMSPEAISRRIEIASQLYEMATLLKKAKKIGRASPEGRGADETNSAEKDRER
jgi:hypothetical protein